MRPVPLDASTVPVEPCRDAGVFDDLEWIPSDARLAVWVDLADPDVSLAAEQLEVWAATEQLLPPSDLLAVRHLAFEIDVVRLAFATLPVEPVTMLKLTRSTGETAWILPPSCDTPSWEAAWRSDTRTFTPGLRGRVGRSRDNASPFDVVITDAATVALTSRDQTSSVLTWLTRRGLEPPDRDHGLGPWLEKIEPAAIRVAFRGVGPTASEHSHVSHPTLRATKDGVGLGLP